MSKTSSDLAAKHVKAKKAQRMKQKVLGRIRREMKMESNFSSSESNFSPIRSKAPKWEPNDIYDAVKFLLISIHGIVGAYFIKHHDFYVPSNF